jgi:hypothetical protein
VTFGVFLVGPNVKQGHASGVDDSHRLGCGGREL